MKRTPRASAWIKTFARGWAAMTRAATAATAASARSLAGRVRPAPATPASPRGTGSWITGVAMGVSGARRFRLYRPPGLRPGERLPLMVMLHGCRQGADDFAASTRMNRIALREHFLVLYPEQDRMANGQGCWNWFDTDTGRAFVEVALIMSAIDQVGAMHQADMTSVAVAGLSAGASMAALLVSRHPERFKALVMHSGIPPGTAHSRLSALRAMRGARATLRLPATPHTMRAGWPPLLVIHGDADPVVSPHNGRAAAQLWAEAVGACASAARTVQRGKRYPMAVTDFKRKGCTVATLVAVAGLGHAWSGGAAGKPFGDGSGPDASRMAWTFAAKQLQASR